MKLMKNRKGEEGGMSSTLKGIIIALVLTALLLAVLQSVGIDLFKTGVLPVKKMLEIDKICEYQGSISDGRYDDFDDDGYPDFCDICIGEDGHNKKADDSRWTDGIPDICQYNKESNKNKQEKLICKYFVTNPSYDKFENEKIQCCTRAGTIGVFNCEKGDWN